MRVYLEKLLCDDYNFYVVRIDADTNVWSRDRTVDGEGGWDGATFDAKYLKYIKAVGPLHPALHRNAA